MSSRKRVTPVKVRVEDKPRKVSEGVQEMSAYDLAAILSSLLKSNDRGEMDGI